MSDKWNDYFDKKESYKLKADFDNLMEHGSPETKKVASQLNKNFKCASACKLWAILLLLINLFIVLEGHRLTFHNVNAFWNKIELNRKLQDQLQAAEVEATSSLINITKEAFATTIGNVHSAVENVNDTLQLKQTPLEEWVINGINVTDRFQRFQQTALKKASTTGLTWDNHLEILHVFLKYLMSTVCKN
ncbi:11834_t:CDS:2 [Paraglomus brasilianum]|uniref:11834_t:CDS:1 n=1 Tax=Paraglomus brasilianum TaxID=144538 RepID=A0A9N9BDB7_9GLOM|nr:11834_t:CDS:2 [Paraglomus brasilianum]